MCPLVSELLELFLGASSLGHFEHTEAYSLAQGPTLTYCDSIAHLDIPDAGGQVYGCILVVFLQAVILSCGVEDISVDDSGLLYLHLDHTRQNLPSDRDITSERAFLVSVGLSVTSLGILKPIPKFLWYIVGASVCQFSKQVPLLILKGCWLLWVGTLSINVHHLPNHVEKENQNL